MPAVTVTADPVTVYRAQAAASDPNATPTTAVRQVTAVVLSLQPYGSQSSSADTSSPPASSSVDSAVSSPSQTSDLPISSNLLTSNSSAAVAGSSDSSASTSSKLPLPIWAIAVIAASAAIVLLVLLGVCLKRRRKKITEKKTKHISRISHLQEADAAVLSPSSFRQMNFSRGTDPRRLDTYDRENIRGTPPQSPAMSIENWRSDTNKARGASGVPSIHTIVSGFQKKRNETKKLPQTSSPMLRDTMYSHQL